jgi:hypothetical protein
MYALVLTLTINLQSFPMFPLSDGSWVYMRTTEFRVAVGQFATKKLCQEYVLPDDASFIVTSTDQNGNPVQAAFPLSTTSYSVVGCEKVL